MGKIGALMSDQLRQQFAKTLAEQDNRRRQRIDKTIINTALDPSDLRWTTEQWRYGWDCFIDTWNTEADLIEAPSRPQVSELVCSSKQGGISRIDGKFLTVIPREEPKPGLGYGKGWFPIRLAHAQNRFSFDIPREFQNFGTFIEAQNKLTYLSTITENPTYDWMGDFLFTALNVSPGLLRWHARDKGGLYNRKLRKTKIGIAQKKLAAISEWMFDEKHREDRAERQAFYLKIKGVHEVLERVVRSDPELGDFTIGKAIAHGEIQTSMRVPTETERRKEGERDWGLYELFVQLSRMSGRAAAAELNRRGIKTEIGGKWHPEQVRRYRQKLKRR
jgi:hypothetical protein